MKKVGKLKEEGNTLFKVGNYSSALLKYDEVYRMLSSILGSGPGRTSVPSKVQFFFRINPIMLLEEEIFPFLEGNANSSKKEQLKQYIRESEMEKSIADCTFMTMKLLPNHNFGIRTLLKYSTAWPVVVILLMKNEREGC